VRNGIFHIGVRLSYRSEEWNISIFHIGVRLSYRSEEWNISYRSEAFI